MGENAPPFLKETLLALFSRFLHVSMESGLGQKIRLAKILLSKREVLEPCVDLEKMSEIWELLDSPCARNLVV